MGSVERVRHKVTFTEMQQWPDDGRRYELYDGEVWIMPSPTLRHQVAITSAMEVLREYERRIGGRAGLSPLDIVFSEHDVLQPDLVYFVPARLRLFQWDQPIRVRPDIAVEVLSPSTARNDRVRKVQTFARYEVPEYWILDPVLRTVEILALRSGSYSVACAGGCGDSLTSPLLPDLSVPVSKLFEDC